MLAKVVCTVHRIFIEYCSYIRERIYVWCIRIIKLCERNKNLIKDLNVIVS